MFVFRAAVVGAGELAGEVARLLGGAGIEVFSAADADDLSGLGSVELAIEALGDRAAAAPTVARLAELTASYAIVASAGPGGVGELGSASGRPERFCGLRFAGPGSRSRVAEVVRGPRTSEAAVDAAVDVVRRMRLHPLVCSGGPGPVIERLEAAARGTQMTGGYQAEPNPSVEAEALPGALVIDPAWLSQIHEACAIVDEGIAGVAAIDAALAAAGSPDPAPGGSAPVFQRADAIGLDDVASAFGRSGDAGSGQAPRLLEHLLARGRLGARTGRGFHAYPAADAGAFAAGAVRLETRDDGVAIAWIADPPWNLLAPPVLAGLATARERAAGAGARVLVVASGVPGVFSAGADVSSIDRDDQASDPGTRAAAEKLIAALAGDQPVTIAAVGGIAYGAGLELALACDLRIAGESARLALPEAGLGLVPGLGGTRRLQRLAGRSVALEVAAGGASLGASRALANGLFSAVVADHDLFDAALAWARGLAAQPPLALAQVKRILAAGGDEAAAVERQAFALCRASADAAEGLAAFRERRPPSWRGR